MRYKELMLNKFLLKYYYYKKKIVLWRFERNGEITVINNILYFIYWCFYEGKSWKLLLFEKKIIRKCFKKVLNSFIKHYY